MTRAETLTVLAERVDAATGPDRGIDLAIYRTHFDEPDRFGTTASGKVQSLVPAYTASLDAAMSLVPEGCWAEGSLASPAALEIHAPMTYDPLGQAQAATPALALTAACLRALASSPVKQSLSNEGEG